MIVGNFNHWVPCMLTWIYFFITATMVIINYYLLAYFIFNNTNNIFWNRGINISKVITAKYVLPPSPLL